MNSKAAIDPEEMFPQVERIIYKLAHRFSKTYPVPYSDCLSEGYLAFMEACRRYDPKRKAKFSSFVYFITWCKLKNLIIKRSKEPLEFCGDVRPWVALQTAPDKSKVMELIEDLSDDAKEIVGLLLETPAELVGVAMTPHQFLRQVRSKVWLPKRKINKACKELRNRFQGEGI